MEYISNLWETPLSLSMQELFYTVSVQTEDQKWLMWLLTIA